MTIFSPPRAPIAIYPAEEAAKRGNQIAFIGTGPFRFVEYRSDSHLRLERFSDHVPNPSACGRDGCFGRGEVSLHSAILRFRRALVAALDMEEIMAVSLPAIFDLDGAWIIPDTPFHTRDSTEH